MRQQLRVDLPDGAIPGDDRFLPARSVWERYGVTSMSLYRWLDDEEMGFPKPLYIGRFRFWRLADLIEWEKLPSAHGDAVWRVGSGSRKLGGCLSDGRKERADRSRKVREALGRRHSRPRLLVAAPSGGRQA
jgi:predicted DNA-binding transcriptional regulator AlpA